ncbi:hypothetical protein TNCV_1615641 [Trichonephila clavipes]|nr:hypothetical protein TNCV_1615641 [Trichonephila clavipes]
MTRKHNDCFQTTEECAPPGFKQDGIRIVWLVVRDSIRPPTQVSKDDSGALSTLVQQVLYRNHFLTCSCLQAWSAFSKPKCLWVKRYDQCEDESIDISSRSGMRPYTPYERFHRVQFCYPTADSLIPARC